MGFCYEQLIRPVLFRRDAEASHESAVRAIRILGDWGLLCRVMERWNQLGKRCRPIRLFGLDFPNAVGLAAGFDKDAVCWPAAAALGFGHVEIGTVTGRRQPGNPRPRVFRYPEAEAVINRMGFNNDGAERIAERLSRSRRSGLRIPLGINIGKSRVVSIEDAAEDYLSSFRMLADFADYVAINVSSPNTPDLRLLQEEYYLLDLLSVLRDANEERAREGKRVPILLKIAPDLTFRQIDSILGTVLDLRFDGIIATNTTLDRPPSFEGVSETGGLSGRPLRSRSTQIINYIHRHTGGKLPIIGVGGIVDPESASEKMDAGASLIQIYTGMIFRGPLFARDAARAVSHRQREWV